MSEPKKEAYDPIGLEERWYRAWEESGRFHAADTSDRPPYSIVIPPPNVTGSLHMGHALNNTLQDVLVRYHRMTGKNVLWMPGTDHAGIATQNVVERALAKEGKTREDVGREAFVARVWEWKQEYGGRILHQLRRLGCSCDWERERFTLDEGLSAAVREVFVRLYEEGLIYRGVALINWCPRCGTALSDIEVEHAATKGSLWHVRYPLADGSGHVTVATTRPETMLGDTAVAVNPEDARYVSLVGKQVVLPLAGRTIPVIADPYVAMDFGTGALKITPAHDANDFAIGAKHGLPTIKVIDDQGRITGGTRYDGLDRAAARNAIVADLEREGLLDKVEPYDTSIGHCYRCKDVVEPNLSRQWFVRTRPLADAAAQAVRDGRTRIIPEGWQKTYFQWLDGIRDWCISRQIWWGHRIPAWTCDACGETLVARIAPTACPKCGGSQLVQDRDVLDTWFSSALWPFSTLGWPEKTPALATFYPTSCLVTGFDILFFWVARMMMMGLKFMGDVPFADVYLHALVRDEHGKKMSKSKGNVIDPLEIVEEFGADAFRMTLVSMAAQGRDIALSRDRIAGYRRFANKVFNATRFALPHLAGMDPARPEPAPEAFSLPDRWVLSRLARATGEVAAAIEEYRFNDAARAAYDFFWHELCDWYLEMAKPVLYVETVSPARDAARWTLATVLDGALRLLHPIMPFLTEDLRAQLPGATGSIMDAPFRVADKSRIDPAAEADLGYVLEAITAVRNVRGVLEVPPGTEVALVVHTADARERDLLAAMETHVRTLAKVGTLTVGAAGEVPHGAAGAVVRASHLYVPVAGLVDLADKLHKVEATIAKIEAKLDKVRAKLANPDFVGRAPAEVVDEQRADEADLAAQVEKARSNRRLIEEALK
jgi:valyl-tRNA synthetase